jgi:Zn-dependent protease with chaperone function
MTSYRYPKESLILSVTLFLVIAVIIITATATFCTSAIFIIGFALVSYYFSRAHHQSLMRSAEPVSSENTPELAALVQQGVSRLRPDPVEVYVAPERALNAYTFGLTSPKVVVLYAGLFKVMDRDELAFILGHELGHVALGHTWLNSLLGGMAGIPASWGAGAILTFAFLWWNRACELSADRAGLLVCGKPEKAITALIKLVAPNAGTQSELQQAYQLIDSEDDSPLAPLTELLASHPLIIHRIEELRRWTKSAQYQKLQAQVNRVV